MTLFRYKQWKSVVRSGIKCILTLQFALLKIRSLKDRADGGDCILT